MTESYAAAVAAGAANWRHKERRGIKHDLWRVQLQHGTHPQSLGNSHVIQSMLLSQVTFPDTSFVPHHNATL
jgi:hypothetical protein